MSKPGDQLKMDLVLIVNGIINMDISRKMIFYRNWLCQVILLLKKIVLNWQKSQEEKEWDASFSGVFPRINRPSTSEITLFVYKPKKEGIESIHLKRIKGKIKKWKKKDYSITNIPILNKIKMIIAMIAMIIIAT
jgi:hypothetical protein